MSIPRALTGISKADSVLSRLSQPPVALSVPSDVPTASTNAINFINKININDIKYTYFADDLMTLSDMQTEMGFYKVSVTESCYKGDNCILVTARSEGKVEEVPCLTELTAYIDIHLQTLYQELHEMVQLQHGTLDRRTVIKLSVDGYDVHKEVKQGEKKEVMEQIFDKSVMQSYISEGANIVLQRILVSKGLPDYFDVVSFDSDTNLCLCSYKDLASTKILVGKEEAQILCYGIERCLHCVTDVPVTWQTYYLCDGHLISRAQVGSPILMKVGNVPQLIEHDEHLEIPIIERVELDWREDAQLTSIFEERKQELASSNRRFVRDHPELQALLADFLQALLAHKPVDTMKFASDFFVTFSNRFVIEGPTQLHTNNSAILLSNNNQ